MRKAFSIGLKQLGQFEQQFAKNVQARRLRNALNKAIPPIIAMLQKGSKKVNYKGRYRSGWYGELKGSSLLIDNKTPHAIFVEKGRGPGRMPPDLPIREWVIFKNLPITAVFPIRRAIGNRGIAGRPYFLKSATQGAITKIVNKTIDDYMKKALSK